MNGPGGAQTHFDDPDNSKETRFWVQREEAPGAPPEIRGRVSVLDGFVMAKIVLS